MSQTSIEGRRFSLSAQWNRALSIRSSKRSSNRSSNGTTASSPTPAPSHGGGHHHKWPGFSLTSLRSAAQPELAKRLWRLIKSANALVGAHETAGRERASIAAQLSEWGEQTGDEAVSDVSDKVGVLLAELGEQEEAYARRLDEARAVLKAVRDTERSVQPSRDGRRRVADEIARLKAREPQSARLVTLEQELVRAEAENLVAEAQLGNVTRQKLREAYAVEFLATIERSEKQAILARHGLRLLQLLDVTPVVPGDARPAYTHASQARQVLNDAEDDLREWRLEGAAISMMPGDDAKATATAGGGGEHDDEQAAEATLRGDEKDRSDEKSRADEKGKQKEMQAEPEGGGIAESG